MIFTNQSLSNPIKMDMTRNPQAKDVRNAIGYGLQYISTNSDKSLNTEVRCTPTVATILKKSGRWSFCVHTSYPDISDETSFTYENQQNLSEIENTVQTNYIDTEIDNLTL